MPPSSSSKSSSSTTKTTTPTSHFVSEDDDGDDDDTEEEDDDDDDDVSDDDINNGDKLQTSMDENDDDYTLYMFVRNVRRRSFSILYYLFKLTLPVERHTISTQVIIRHRSCDSILVLPESNRNISLYHQIIDPQYLSRIPGDLFVVN